ncbi:hypothetical protein [Aliamphritea spongicola]|nr:hypothetical protein [Aliamphritea spongicola]
MVKFFSAYNDILRYLIEKKNGEENISLEPYHIYFEFGSCNRHTLQIMALGVSRFTAIYLSKVLKFDANNLDTEDYYKELKNVNFDRLEIPELCKQEVLSLLGN